MATRIDGLGWFLDEPVEWPRLAALPDPPAFLCRKGRPCGIGPVLAMVGARSATGYGLRMARDLARGVAGAGVTVVSGLARGIDAAAHVGALAAGGHTIAVLGSGPDRAYPPEHAALQERIGCEGTLLTEFLPGTPPVPGNFPRRNRVLVAIADAVLLVEARIKSGSLTSIRWAADLGREVLVLPGPVDSELAEGPLQLLREGATPVGSVDHILEALPAIVAAATAVVPAAAAATATPRPAVTTPAEERILALVRGAPVDMDDLVRLSGEPPSRVLTLVLSLETRGLIAREPGGRALRTAQP